MIKLRLFNDNALEFAIALARVLSVLAALATVVAVIGSIWSDGDAVERWLATGAVLAAVAAGTGWTGWWAFGNATWKGRYRQGGPIGGGTD